MTSKVEDSSVRTSLPSGFAFILKLLNIKQTSLDYLTSITTVAWVWHTRFAADLVDAWLDLHHHGPRFLVIILKTQIKTRSDEIQYKDTKTLDQTHIRRWFLTLRCLNSWWYHSEYLDCVGRSQNNQKRAKTHRRQESWRASCSDCEKIPCLCNINKPPTCS